jgi:hypothetical protein
MRIEVNIEKRYFFGLLALGLIIIGIVGVFAYNSAGTGGVAAVFGHSVDEIDWAQTINASINATGSISANMFCLGTNCVTEATGWPAGGGNSSTPSSNGTWGKTGSSIFYNGGNVGIGTNNPGSKLDVVGLTRTDDLIVDVGASVSGTLKVYGDIEVGGEVKNSGMRCTTWKFDNRAGTDWKYWKFDMPYACEPAHETAGQGWGCTYQIDPEWHSSSNLAGVWNGHRGGAFTIWDNGYNTGHHYMDVWDYSSINTFDLDISPAEIILYYHTHNVCGVTDSWYDGTWHQGSTSGAGEGWKDWGFQAYSYTTCYLKICEVPGTGAISGSSTVTKSS